MTAQEESRPTGNGAASRESQRAGGDTAQHTRSFEKASAALAHRAIESGEVASDGAMIAVPDVVEAAGRANGMPELPATWTVHREDGRYAFVFRAPRGAR